MKQERENSTASATNETTLKKINSHKNSIGQDNFGDTNSYLCMTEDI